MDPLDEPAAVRLSSEQFGRLIDSGIVDAKVEFLGGRITYRGYAASFSPAQIRDAARLGIDLRPGASSLGNRAGEGLAPGASGGDPSAPPTAEEVLDGIPGAFERVQESRRQARRGETVPLDELDAQPPDPAQ